MESAFLGALLGLLLATACGGGPSAPPRSSGSALWMDSDAGPVTAEDAEDLAGVGLEELFVEVGRVDWEGSEPQVEADWDAFDLPARRPVTLVLTTVEPPAEVDGEAAAHALATRVESLVLEGQRRGLLPVGVHVHPVAAFEREEATGRFLGHLARQLGERLPVSLTLEPARLDPAATEATVQLARGVGAVVSFLYGQRPEEPEDSEAWSLDAVMAGVERLEELGDDLGIDYLLGVITLGRLDLEGADEGALTTRVSLRTLLSRPELDLGFGLSLEDTDRRLWKFDLNAPMTLDSRRLSTGDSLRVSQVGGEYLRELRHRLGQMELDRHLGEVFYRPPRPEEGLSLRPAQLATALDPQASRPRIEARFTEQRRGGRLLLVVELENVGDRGTDIARRDANYIDLTTARGSFVEARSLGDFQRYNLIDSTTGEQTLRSPDLLRLFIPYLAPGERVASGPLVATRSAAGQVRLSGSFRLPDGTPIPVVDVTGREAVDTGDGEGGSS